MLALPGRRGHHVRQVVTDAAQIAQLPAASAAA
jgi:hypothetical protein